MRLLNKEEKEMLVLLAGAWMSLDEISIAMNIDRNELKELIDSDADDDVKTIVMRERMLSKAKLQKQIFEMAHNGSSVAQQMAQKIIDKTVLDEQLK